ncbi:MAG: hypothetical protein WCK35_00935 [Chloroflexota bacterium]
MKRSAVNLLFICIFLLTACNLPTKNIKPAQTDGTGVDNTPSSPAASNIPPTVQEQAAATQEPSATQEPAATPAPNTPIVHNLRLVLRNADQSLSQFDLTAPQGTSYTPTFSSFLPMGGSAQGSIYALDFSNSPAKAVIINSTGKSDLAFISNPNYGLAVWPGNEQEKPRLAWGSVPGFDSNPSLLQISNMDGSQLQTLLTEEINKDRPSQIVAEFWSADGQFLYFSKEPFGIGGYILFAGGSNLFRININTKEVMTLIPEDTAMICLDAVSNDYQLAADHCTPKQITIRNLTNNGASTAILAPAELNAFELMGSARFSPDGNQIAFALAKGDPSNEQGWLAVADSTGGTSKLVFTSQPGSYVTIDGWLDSRTLLIESSPIECNPTCSNQIWTIALDGTNLTKIADGNIVTAQQLP